MFGFYSFLNLISSIHSREKAEDGGKTSIIKTDFPEDSGNASDPENNNQWISIAVPIVVIGVIVVSAFGVVFIWPRRRNDLSYSSVSVINNNNTTIHNYHNSNVQIGNENTQNVHEPASENVSAASTDED